MIRLIGMPFVYAGTLIGCAIILCGMGIGLIGAYLVESARELDEAL